MVALYLLTKYNCIYHTRTRWNMLDKEYQMSITVSLRFTFSRFHYEF